MQVFRINILNKFIITSALKVWYTHRMFKMAFKHAENCKGSSSMEFHIHHCLGSMCIPRCLSLFCSFNSLPTTEHFGSTELPWTQLMTTAILLHRQRQTTNGVRQRYDALSKTERNFDWWYAEWDFAFRQLHVY